MQNVFTVDLEEWFHGLTSTNGRVESWPRLESRVVGATRHLLTLLRRAQVRATFFVLGHVADHHPALIDEIRADGHELGIHGYYHRFIYRLSPAEFAEEIDRSLAALMRITGEQPHGHRAPYFSVNQTTPWAFETLARLGLRYDSSVFPTRNMLYGYPGAPRFPYPMQLTSGDLWQLPASTVRLGGVNWPMAGGFYVRAMPYVALRAAVRHLNAAGRPAILYVHPWELDLGQNYPHVTARERITHYHGRASLAAKLERLFADFAFGPAVDLVDDLAAEGPTASAGLAPMPAHAERPMSAHAERPGVV
ncbi:MAG: polysaccharide deacetylase family protein [Litorilinea sp.]